MNRGLGKRFFPSTIMSMWCRAILRNNLSLYPRKIEDNFETIVSIEATNDEIFITKKELETPYKISKPILDSILQSDNYVIGYAEPFSTILLTSDDELIGSGRVNKEGEFNIYTYDYLKYYSMIKAQVIYNGSYQGSITVNIHQVFEP